MDKLTRDVLIGLAGTAAGAGIGVAIGYGVWGARPAAQITPPRVPPTGAPFPSKQRHAVTLRPGVVPQGKQVQARLFPSLGSLPVSNSVSPYQREIVYAANAAASPSVVQEQYAGFVGQGSEFIELISALRSAAPVPYAPGQDHAMSAFSGIAGDVTTGVGQPRVPGFAGLNGYFYLFPVDGTAFVRQTVLNPANMQATYHAAIISFAIARYEAARNVSLQALRDLSYELGVARNGANLMPDQSQTLRMIGRPNGNDRC